LSAALHVELVFGKDAGRSWQTSDINQALAVGAARPVLVHVKQTLLTPLGIRSGIAVGYVMHRERNLESSKSKR
jgi:hypothetical protein